MLLVQTPLFETFSISFSSADLQDPRLHYHQRWWVALYSSVVGAYRFLSRSRYFDYLYFNQSYDFAAFVAARSYLALVKALLPVAVTTTARLLWLPLGGPCLLARFKPWLWNFLWQIVLPALWFISLTLWCDLKYDPRSVLWGFFPSGVPCVTFSCRLHIGSVFEFLFEARLTNPMLVDLLPISATSQTNGIVYLPYSLYRKFQVFRALESFPEP